jgi:hypothetical protein
MVEFEGYPKTSDFSEQRFLPRDISGSYIGFLALVRLLLLHREDKNLESPTNNILIDHATALVRDIMGNACGRCDDLILNSNGNEPIRIRYR